MSKTFENKRKAGNRHVVIKEQQNRSQKKGEFGNEQRNSVVLADYLSYPARIAAIMTLNNSYKIQFLLLTPDEKIKLKKILNTSPDMPNLKVGTSLYKIMVSVVLMSILLTACGDTGSSNVSSSQVQEVTSSSVVVVSEGQANQLSQSNQATSVDSSAAIETVSSDFVQKYFPLTLDPGSSDNIRDYYAVTKEEEDNTEEDHELHYSFKFFSNENFSDITSENEEEQLWNTSRSRRMGYEVFINGTKMNPLVVQMLLAKTESGQYYYLVSPRKAALGALLLNNVGRSDLMMDPSGADGLLVEIADSVHLNYSLSFNEESNISALYASTKKEEYPKEGDFELNYLAHFNPEPEDDDFSDITPENEADFLWNEQRSIDKGYQVYINGNKINSLFVEMLLASTGPDEFGEVGYYYEVSFRKSALQFMLDPSYEAFKTDYISFENQTIQIVAE